jgi:GTP-binding protein HflX
MTSNAIVLHPDSKKILGKDERFVYRNANSDSELQEIIGLAKAINLKIAYSESIPLTKIRAATLFGIGVIDRIKLSLNNAVLVIINCSLTPIQQRNLELAWECKVIDRTALILEIFGARARTHEGRLQVELAALSFQRSRLVRSWTHLERQRGGAGFLGGPGERQIELDRRQIDDKIIQLKSELERVTKTRLLHRKARNRRPFPTIAFVGYTNAGKSTLFNYLTGANVLAENMLFATLDPTMRKMKLPSGRQVILSDTVGFISNLPTHLIAAFRATLEEVMEADIIIHVRDISHPDTSFHKNDVEKVLKYIGVDENNNSTQIIEVLNKTDILPPGIYANLQQRSSGKEVLVSALAGDGCQELCERIDTLLGAEEATYSFQLNFNDSAAIAWLHEYGNIREKHLHEEFFTMSVKLSMADANKFSQRFGEVQVTNTS